MVFQVQTLAPSSRYHFFRGLSSVDPRALVKISRMTRPCLRLQVTVLYVVNENVNEQRFWEQLFVSLIFEDYIHVKG